MSEMTFDQAAAALANAGNEGSSPEAPVSEPAAPVTETAGTTEAPQSAPDSTFTVDLDSLPAEVRPMVEKRLAEQQADYTRKTQEVAPFRQMLETYGMDAESASQALALAQSLSDPNVQRELYNRLSAVYGEPSAEGEYYDEQQYEGADNDPRDRAIEQLQGRLDAFERQQAMGAIERTLDQHLSAVQKANPNFNESDMTRVQQIALSHGGNVIAAAEEYKAWKTGLISEYINGKASVDPGSAPLAGGAHAETPPQGFGTDLDAAHKAALSRYFADPAAGI